MPVMERPQPSDVRKAFTSAVDGDPARKSYGQPVFSLGLRGLSAAAPAVRHVGWQLCTVDTRGAIVSGDVPIAARPNQSLGSSKNQGTAARKVWEACDELDALPDLRDREYERWTLRVPELNIEAYWLKAPPYENNLGPADYVYPVISFAKSLPERRLLSMSAFLTEIRRLAPSQVAAKAVL